jgi:hypothetical protein
VTGAGVMPPVLLLRRCGDAVITVIVMITVTITMIVMIRAAHCYIAISRLSVPVSHRLTCTAHACETINNSKNTIFFSFRMPLC